MMPLATTEKGVSYSVKVKAEKTRSRTHLFGSGKVMAPFQSNLVLIIRVDPEGERITLVSRRDENGGENEICVLDRGEVFAVTLKNLIYVAAYGSADTRVHCCLITDH